MSIFRTSAQISQKAQRSRYFEVRKPVAIAATFGQSARLWAMIEMR